MRARKVVFGSSLITALAVTALASSANAEEAYCPDGLAFGSGCTAGNALANCQTEVTKDYGSTCIVLCARCTGGGYNCFMSAAQCN